MFPGGTKDVGNLKPSILVAVDMFTVESPVVSTVAVESALKERLPDMGVSWQVVAESARADRRSDMGVYCPCIVGVRCKWDMVTDDGALGISLSEVTSGFSDPSPTEIARVRLLGVLRRNGGFKV